MGAQVGVGGPLQAAESSLEALARVSEWYEGPP